MTVLDKVDANREIEAAPRVADYVVDADVHVTPPPQMWKEYLSPQFRDQAPTVETEGDVDYIVFEGQRRQVHLMQSQAGRKTDEYKNVGKFSDMRLGGWQAEKRIEDMDRDGMDKAVLFGGGPLQTGNLDLFFDSFDAFNRWQSDFCAHDPQRLFSAAFLPTVDVPTTVRMMNKAKLRGDVAVNIPAFPQSIRNFTKMSSIWQAMTGDAGGDRQYRDPEFDPIWATAQELDLAITFHLGARISRYKDKTNFLPDIPMGQDGHAGGRFHHALRRRLRSVSQAAHRPDRERRGLDTVGLRVHGPYLGDAAPLDRMRHPASAQPLLRPERLRLVRLRPDRHRTARQARVPQHHVVVRLPAFRDDFPAQPRRDRGQLPRRAESRARLDHRRLRGKILRARIR
jgi:predicted TIM-barrel fold metal-dependent hydrolase